MKTATATQAPKSPKFTGKIDRNLIVWFILMGRRQNANLNTNVKKTQHGDLLHAAEFVGVTPKAFSYWMEKCNSKPVYGKYAFGRIQKALETNGGQSVQPNKASAKNIAYWKTMESSQTPKSPAPREAIKLFDTAAMVREMVNPAFWVKRNLNEARQTVAAIAKATKIINQERVKAQITAMAKKAGIKIHINY